ncbi:MAG: calcium/sodium antiporter [Betaproteobacteria bacterium]|nr:calcium/sodium antiporter [Betaproteobacteria bacterium]
MIPILQLVGGLFVLVYGADLLVGGASRLATLLRVSPLAISLTVVAYGTGAPELAVSSVASWSGDGDLALGNVVGSNIFNVLVVLGVSSLIGPLLISRQILKLDLPVMIGASVLLLVLSRDGNLGLLDCLALITCFAIYATLHWRMARRESRASRATGGADAQHPDATGRAYARELGLILFGLVMLVTGSHWLVEGASALADAMGASHTLVGLAIVAPGTGLPELATSVVASLRGERDIAVGNIIGSNTFNILAVLGVSGLVSRTGFHVAPALLSFDMPVMVGIALACFPIFLNDLRLGRLEGIALTFYYGVYLAYLVLDATNSGLLPGFDTVVRYGIVPVTVLGLVGAGVRGVRRHILRTGSTRE